MTARTLLLALLAAAGCTDEAASPGGCVDNSGCEAGSVCIGGACASLCVSDGDCDDGRICRDGACAACAGCRQVPEVTAIDGSGSDDGRPGRAAHHLREAITLYGRNLSGAQVQLSGGRYAGQQLALCGAATDERLDVRLPADISAGAYSLTVTNQAGSCGAELQLLEGERGPPGSYTIGAGLDGSGGTLSVVFGNGPATVAAGDHGHADLLPLTGGVIGGDLEVTGRLGAIDGLAVGGAGAGRFVVHGQRSARAAVTVSSSAITALGMVAPNGFAPLVDGDLAAGAWHTDSAPAGSWVQIDFGSSPKELVRVRIHAQSAGYRGVYDMEWSDTGSSWTAAGRHMTPSAQGANDFAFPRARAHRYWRLRLLNAPGGGPWLTELELDESAPGPAISVTDDGKVGIGDIAPPTAALHLGDELRLGGRLIGRITTCSFNGTADSPQSSNFYHFWGPGECDLGPPRGACIGFITSAVHSGADQDWQVMVPGQAIDNFPTLIAYNGGMQWWCSTCSASDFKKIAAAYVCDQ